VALRTGSSLEQRFAAAVESWRGDPVGRSVPRCGACERRSIFWDGTFWVQAFGVWAAAGRVFYTVAENHFNCGRRGLHAQHRLSPETRERDRADFEDDVRFGLREAGRGAADSAIGERAGGDCVCAAGRGAGCAGRGFCLRAGLRGAMLLNEAAGRAGGRKRDSGAGAGRPCMALPAALQHGFDFEFWDAWEIAFITGLGEDEMYLVFARQGSRLRLRMRSA